MRDQMFLIFKQIGERATRHDTRVAYIIGANKDAQEECNRLNSKGNGYYYYMDADEVKKEGTEI